MGKSFGCMDIDIECKNISISGDIGGGGDIVYQIVQIWETEKVLFEYIPNIPNL